MSTSISLPTTSGVYQITNITTSKIYIGSSVNIYRRWTHHRWQLRNNCHSCTFLQRAWNKYGEKAFLCTVVEIVSDITLLRTREQYYLDSLLPHYNALPTAGTWLGAKHTEAAKAKMSARRKGIPARPEVRAMRAEQLAKLRADPAWRMRVSETLKGRVFSTESRAKISAATKGLKRSPEACKALGDRSRGRKASDETRAKMSASRTGKIPTAEHRANVSKGLQGHVVSEETKAKISASHLGKRWSDEARAKMSEQRKGRAISDEQKEKLRQAALERWARKKAEDKARDH